MQFSNREHYFKVSWHNGGAFMLFDDIDHAQSQFHYECVFEDNVKLETITRQEYEELSKLCVNGIK